MRPCVGETGLLWLGLLAGPLAWSVQLQANYALSDWARQGRPLAALHLVSAACLLAAAGGGWLAWRNWRSVGGWPAPRHSSCSRTSLSPSSTAGPTLCGWT